MGYEEYSLEVGCEGQREKHESAGQRPRVHLFIVLELLGAQGRALKPVEGSR